MKQRSGPTKKAHAESGIVRWNSANRFKVRLVGWSRGAPLGFEPSDLVCMSEGVKGRPRKAGPGHWSDRARYTGRARLRCSAGQANTNATDYREDYP
jgi:hypothetical protein